MHDANRVLAWRRWGDGEDFLVLASLNNHPFRDGYTVANPRLPDGRWKEVFNSDSDTLWRGRRRQLRGRDPRQRRRPARRDPGQWIHRPEARL